MDFIYFFIYLILLCWLVYYIPFVKASLLSNKLIVGLLFIKFFVGIFLGWFSQHYYTVVSDYYYINKCGYLEYQLLLNHPKEYFTNIFTSVYQNGYQGLFSSNTNYWNDLTNNVIIKFISILNVFSNGNYFINSLFVNFFVFLGHVAIYRVFINLYPNKFYLVLIGSFLLPSTLYFTSGINKDAFMFLLFGVLLFQLQLFFNSYKNKFKNAIKISICIFFLFLVRNYTIAVIAPAILAWLLANYTKWSSLKSYILVYGILGLFVFSVTIISPKHNPLKFLEEKQLSFLNLPVGKTQISIPVLDTLHSNYFFIKVPSAIAHCVGRPYFFEIPYLILLPINIELLLFQILFVLFLFYHKNDLIKANHSILFYCIFFTLSAYIFIGFISPNLGTLIRYRSVYFPFLILPILCSIDWERICNAQKKVQFFLRKEEK